MVDPDGITAARPATYGDRAAMPGKRPGALGSVPSMDTTAEPPRTDENEKTEKTGWGLAVLFSGGLLACVRHGGTSGWWIALWAPLLILAALVTAYEWSVSARIRFRMGPWEWFALLGTHVGLLLGGGIAVGLLDP
ncbi:hypothetical protein EES41_22875 [Streptomyces sp. ADI95-16]|nr:hypothetical protein EES41_22875 [Streptomyces sp. ADI95-16]